MSISPGSTISLEAKKANKDCAANSHPTTGWDADVYGNLLVGLTAPFLALGYCTAVTVLKMAGRGHPDSSHRNSVPQGASAFPVS